MSLNFTTDNSVQLTYTSFPFTTAELDNYATSNSVYITSNTLNTKINTKQDTLTAGTNLLGVGTAITAIDYNKITINKPTNFQSDWNSTIINKPTIYTQTETNNLLNAKEQILTFTAPLTRTTNTIGINLSSYSTTGTDASYLLKTGGTLTGTLNGTTINASTSLQEGAINLTSKYLQLSGGNMTANANITLSGTGTFTGIHSGNGAALTNLPLSAYSTTGNDANYLLKTGGTLSGALNGTTINASTNLQEGAINLTSKYLQLTGGAMTANANITLSGTGTFTGIHSGNGSGLTNLPLSAYSTTGNDVNYLLKTGGTLTGALNGTTINASTSLQEGAINLTSKYLQLAGGTLTGALNGTTINASTNLQEGAINLTSKYLQLSGGTLTGTLNGTTINASTNLQEGAVNLTSKYLQLSGGNMTANANITLSGTGTFNGIHSGNGSAINALDYNNITLNKPDLNIFSNVLYTLNYTAERPYPPKIYNSSTSQSIVTYLTQNPTYYETFNLTTTDITYGSGTYEVRSSSIDDTNITFSGTGNTLTTVTANTDFSYISFINNGTLTLNSSIICDILIIGGGGGGGSRAGPGGGAGTLIYKTNFILSNGVYSINIGNGGAGGSSAAQNPGANGADTSIINTTTTTTVFLAKGGGGASAGGAANGTNTSGDTDYNGNNGGSGGGGYKAGSPGVKVTTNIPQDSDAFGNNGATGTSSNAYGGGGGGAGSSGVGFSTGGNFGNGGLAKLISITNTPTYYAGGGGAGNRYNGFFRGFGGVGAGAGASNPSISGGAGDGAGGGSNGYSALANTGSGGGGGGYDFGPGGSGGNGGSGIVIIRFLKSTTKKELFNLNTNDYISPFKSFQYNTSTGNYLTTNRYINNYYGDWIIIKKPYAIYLTKYRIYNNPSFIQRAPSLFKIFASTDGSIYDEIINASNNTTALTTSSYSSGYFEKIVNYFTKPYLYFALVVNKIIAGVSDSHLLNISEFQIFGEEILNITPNISLDSSSNLILSTSNSIILYNNNINSVIVNSNGNVGIGTTNPNSIFQVGDGARLKISNGVNDFSVIGTKNIDDTTNTRIVISGNTRGSFEGRIEYLSTAGDHIFYTNATNERMRISNNGTINIVNKLQVAGNDINNFLFNNTGRNHATYQDFNAIDKFGYSYIQNSTNGPGVDSQYYSWYIGLGNEYPFASSANGYFGMQFAIGRYQENPKLSVRRKEGNNAVWTGWQGLTAEKAESLTSGDKTISGNLNITGSLSGAVNVSRRAQFTFTPSQVLISGLGLRYIHTINLNNYITGINSSISGINRVFRITIWGESGDFGDSTNNVETMQFLIFMSFFGGINGGKRRIYQIINESNGSTISYSNAETVYYNGWNGTGGAATKFCIIENIAGY